MLQEYPGEKDIITHFNNVLPAFKDKRYITVDGKPIFMIYDPIGLPNPKHFMDRWNSLARENGLIGIHFVGLASGWLSRYQHISVTYAGGTSEGSNVITVDPKAADSSVLNVTNTYKKVEDITIHKVGDNGDSLNGAQFQLYYETEAGETYYTETGWVKEKPADAPLKSGNYGLITIPASQMDTAYTYYLVETKAPDGYKLLEHEIEISWDQNGDLTVSYGNIASQDSPVKIENGQIVVTNTAGFELPETGGAGTTMNTIGGLLLMTAAAGGGYGLRRRRGKGGR